MENNAVRQTHSSMMLPERVRHRLADDQGTVRIIAASAQNWPELTSLSIGEIVLGDDGLIRLALWSASKCCATLLGTRRATLLLREGDDAWEIRCLVMTNTSLTTPRPLSGFLLKPVELQDASRNARDIGWARRTPEDNEHRAGETRVALFEAFPPPVTAEEQPPLGRIHPS